ncbi:MAG: MFS transporter [Clostridia bacterium]|nr:MFS transporter [Clostridia bacterium]
MKRNLTLRYALQQSAYWAACAGIMSFASAYLMAKGFSASIVGILLAAGNLLSCAVQPLMAARADRAGSQVVRRYIVGLSLCCLLCFVSLLALPEGSWIFGLAYLAGIFAYDVMTPLNNALCVAWRKADYRIDYGVGRGMGSFAYSLAALAIGQAIAGWGEDWMIGIVAALLCLNLAAALSFPRIEKTAGEKAQSTCCSIPVFFRRYKWYCVSLLGVMLLAAFHVMAENYLIKVMERLGGDSGHVGVALFIATTIATVVLIFFDKIRLKTGDQRLLKLAGLFYTVKAVAFLLAPSIGAIYVAQLLQAVTYAFLSPTQMYYANSRVVPEDMVKGQAFITAAYTLGCALGNFTGGQMVEAWGVVALLRAGVLIAAFGAAVLFLTVNRKDKFMEEAA